MKYNGITEENIVKKLKENNDNSSLAAIKYIEELKWALSLLHSKLTDIPCFIGELFKPEDWVRYQRAYYGYTEDDPLEDE